MTKSNAKSILLGAGIVVGLLIFTVISKNHSPSASFENTYRIIVKKSETVSQIRIDLLKSAEMEHNAVMAITDEESKEFAGQSRAAAAAVKEDFNRLRGLIGKAPLANEQKLALEFDTCWTELSRIDNTILALAVQNTNLKAAALSREKGAETVQRFRHALEEVSRIQSGLPDEARVSRLICRAVTSVLSLYNLHSSHIVESSDAIMDQIEARMKLAENDATKALDELAGLVDTTARPSLSLAKTALSDFMAVSKEVVRLSRQNSNVKSLELSLGRRRKVAAQCDEILTALTTTVQNSPVFKATR